VNQGSYRNKYRANFRMIEAELYSYHESLKEIETIKNDIIYSTASKEVNGHTGPGNPTLSKICTIIADYELAEQERRCNAIKKVINKLEQNYPLVKKLVTDKYFAKIGSDKIICTTNNIAEATFYRWRRFVIHQIAAELGWRVQV